MSLWWSALLTPLGLIGMYVTGRKKRIGWLYGLCTQVAWIAYAVMTHQWFFIIGSLAYAGIYLKNYVQWGKENSQEPVKSESVESDIDIYYKLRNEPSPWGSE